MVHKNWGHAVPLVSMAVMLVAAVGCSTASSPSTSQSGGSEARGAKQIKTLTFANPLPSYAGWHTAETCMKKEGKVKGVDVTAVGPTGANPDNSQSIEDVNRAIATKQDAIALDPVDKSFQDAINRARAAGIYVASVDTLGTASNVNADIGVSLQGIGRTLVDGVGKQFPDAHFATLSLSPSSIQRQEFAGMTKEIQAKYPKMKLVTNVYDNNDLTKDVDLIKNMLLAHPDVNFIFSANGASTSAVVTAVKEIGRTGKVKVIVNDLTPESIAGLRAGTVWGVNDQAWCTMGTKTVDSLVDIASGKLPQNKTYSLDAGLTFVTKANLAQALKNPA